MKPKETYVKHGERDFTVKTLSAYKYMLALTDSAACADHLGIEENETLKMAACLSLALFENGRLAFSTPVSVLENFTRKEIKELYLLCDLSSVMYYDGTMEENTVQYRENTEFSKSYDPFVFDSIKELNPKKGEEEEEEESAVKGQINIFEGKSEREGAVPFYPDSAEEKAGLHTVGAEEVSERAERDFRRYDSAFTPY